MPATTSGVDALRFAPVRPLHYHRAMVLLLHRFLLALCLAALSATPAAAAEFSAAALEGSFEGPLVIGRDNMNLAFTFARQGDAWTAALISGGMGIYGMPADTVQIDGLKLLIRIPRLDVEFTGTLRLSDDGASVERIDGDWFQYSEMVPVVLRPVASPSF